MPCARNFSCMLRLPRAHAAVTALSLRCCSVEAFTVSAGIQAFGGLTNMYSIAYTVTSTFTSLWYILTSLSWLAVAFGLGFCMLSCIITWLLVMPVAR